MCFLCVRSDFSDDNYGWLSHVNSQTRSVDETQDAAADPSTVYSVQAGDVFYGTRDSFSDRDWIATKRVCFLDLITRSKDIVYFRGGSG